jgi:hypothetical protein
MTTLLMLFTLSQTPAPAMSCQNGQTWACDYFCSDMGPNGCLRWVPVNCGCR